MSVINHDSVDNGGDAADHHDNGGDDAHDDATSHMSPLTLATTRPCICRSVFSNPAFFLSRL